MNVSHPNLVWIDLEMTGLYPEHDQILEIASIITDSELNIVARGPDIVIHCPIDILEQMDDWNRKHHKESGLWDESLISKNTMQSAEEETLSFLQKHIQQGQSPLCGNSIWQDRRFLARYMPKIDQSLHYRMIDVSSVKELANRWFPKLNKFTKSGAHRAMDDIQESIKELDFYRSEIFTK